MARIIITTAAIEDAREPITLSGLADELEDASYDIVRSVTGEIGKHSAYSAAGTVMAIAEILRDMEKQQSTC